MAVFDNLCPNCRSSIEDTRLQRGIPCSVCYPEENEQTSVCHSLQSRNVLKLMEDVCRAKSLVEDFKRFFEERVGEPPWSLQLTWAKRVFMGKSFAIQAPTGIGKTTFGAVMAAYIEGKSYIIVPTKLLVEQLLDRVNRFTRKKVVAYTGKKKEKEIIASGDFDILITTQAFLRKNVDILPKNFSFIFVDDVDSVLKNPKNVDNLFKLMGLDE